MSDEVKAEVKEPIVLKLTNPQHKEVLWDIGSSLMGTCNVTSDGQYITLTIDKVVILHP